jgi:hypothetical protein
MPENYEKLLKDKAYLEFALIGMKRGKRNLENL